MRFALNGSLTISLISAPTGTATMLSVRLHLCNRFLFLCLKNGRKCVVFPPHLHRLVPAAKPADATSQKIYCEICKKAFSTKNQFLQHERSKRHLKGLKEAQEAFQKSADEAEVKDNTEAETATEKNTEEEKLGFKPEEYTFDANRCIFCGIVSDTLDALHLVSGITCSNIAHMTQKHGFLIPDRHCLKDLEGLLDYLGQKVGFRLWVHDRFP